MKLKNKYLILVITATLTLVAGLIIDTGETKVRSLTSNSVENIKSVEIGFTEQFPNKKERGVATPASGGSGGSCVLTFSNSSIMTGEDFSVSSDVTFGGGSRYGDTMLYRCEVGGAMCNTSTAYVVANLTSAADFTRTYNAAALGLTPGSYVFFVDYGRRETHYQIHNANERDEYLSFSHYATYNIDCFNTLTVSGPLVKPDLKPTGSTYGPYVANDIVNFQLNIGNIGEAVGDPYTTAVARIDIGNDGTYNDFAYFASEPALSAGDTQLFLSEDWIAVEGDHCVQFRVDYENWTSGGVVDESDEGNNETLCMPFTVVPATVSGPNLTSDNIVVVGTLTEGVNVASQISADVLNSGTVDIGPNISFTDVFEYSYGSNAGPWTFIDGVEQNFGAADIFTAGTSIAGESPNAFTPPTSGDIYIRHCVDYLAQIDEEDETDQCSIAGPFVVSSPSLLMPSVSLSATSPVNAGDSTLVSWSVDTKGVETTCTPSGGGSTDWSTNNRVAGQLTGVESGSDTLGPINADTTFNLYCENADGSDTDSATVIVQSGGGGNACNSPGLEAEPPIIRSSETTTLSWENTTDGATCTLTGGGESITSNSTENGGDPCNDGDGNELTVNPSNTTTYTLTCDADPAGNPVTWTDTVTVYVIPTGGEN